jgi:hypothetical protein
MWGLWAWFDDDSAGPERGVTLSQVADEPEDYLGQTVTISGEVEERWARAFTIGGGALGEEVLVLPKAGVTVPPVTTDDRADDVLQVTGTVRVVDDDNRAALGDEFDAWDGEPAIIATSVKMDAQ